MLNDMTLESLNGLLQGVLGCTYVYVLTKQWRYSRSATIKIFVAFCAVYIGVANFIVYKMGLTQTSKACLALFGLTASAAVFCYLPRYRDGRALFVCVSTISFNLISAGIGEAMGSTSTIARLIIKIAIYLLVFIFIYHYFRHPLTRLMDEMEKGWHKLTLIPFSISLLCLFLLLSEEVYHNLNYKFMALSLAFVMFASYLALYHMFCTLQTQYRAEANYELLKSQMESLKKHMDTVAAGEEQMKIFRHDIRHYIAIQTSCLDDGNIDGARTILASMEKNLSSAAERAVEYTDSPFINAVIAGYSDRARAGGIGFSASMSMPDRQDIDYLELAVVISNALENAWHACSAMSVEKERYIKLIGAPRQSQYFFEVLNTYDSHIQFDRESGMPTSDEAGHGYGTKSITAFAQKHHAYIDFKAEGTVFRMRMIL